VRSAREKEEKRGEGSGLVRLVGSTGIDDEAIAAVLVGQ